MALRILNAVVSDGVVEELLTALEGDEYPQVIAQWCHGLSDDRSSVHILLDAESTEPVTDAIARICQGDQGFRIVMLPVEATLPQVKAPDAAQSAKAEEAAAAQVGRVSREELYADVSDSARFTMTSLALVILSALVAVIGLARSNVAIIIGAMVIAPFLGPNVALALATTLADGVLALRSLRGLATGLLVALVVAGLAGVAIQPDATIPEIASRTVVGWGDIVLAIASGAAGGLAYTTGAPTALVGVMVAVALLPPWVAFGMLLGAGHWGPALGALLLTALNIICLNLAGVLTFIVQGVSPAAWWEAERAKRLSFIALGVWIGLLAVFAVLLLIVRLK